MSDSRLSVRLWANDGNQGDDEMSDAGDKNQADDCRAADKPAPRSLAAKLDALFREVKRPVDDPDEILREYTLAEVGAAIGRSPEYVGYLRYGQRDNPSVKVLRDLAKFFGTRVSDLADEDVPIAEVKRRVATWADTSHTMAERLARLFDTVDYTDEQVADAVGVEPRIISSVRAGDDIDVSVTLLQALAAFFGVPVSYLLSRADDPEVVRVDEQLAMLKHLRDSGMIAMAMRATMVRNPVGREALAAMVETFIQLESGQPGETP
jgi:transcriptional regulator with XRE-family HTH domain